MTWRGWPGKRVARYSIHVSGRNERVLRSFLGLASQVIHPTGDWAWAGLIRTVRFALRFALRFASFCEAQFTMLCTLSGPNGEEPSKTHVLVPPGVTVKMLPTVPVAFGATGPSTAEQSFWRTQWMGKSWICLMSCVMSVSLSLCLCLSRSLSLSL